MNSVTVVKDVSFLEVIRSDKVVEVVAAGPQGPSGPQGPQGPPGLQNVFVQATPPANPQLNDLWVQIV